MDHIEVKDLNTTGMLTCSIQAHPLALVEVLTILLMGQFPEVSQRENILETLQTSEHKGFYLEVIHPSFPEVRFHAYFTLLGDDETTDLLVSKVVNPYAVPNFSHPEARMTLMMVDTAEFIADFFQAIKHIFCLVSNFHISAEDELIGRGECKVITINGDEYEVLVKGTLIQLQQIAANK